jgi:hypothetical protein
LCFAALLESTDSHIEVFCSSESGSIAPGENFINVIFDNLSVCDLFVPLLSLEYYQSKFCMIELGVAYAYLYNKYAEKGETYIVPVTVYPVEKGNALADTPMSNIQVSSLSDEKDIRNLLNVCAKYTGETYVGINRKIHSFTEQIKQLTTDDWDIFAQASDISCFDTEGVNYKKKNDIVWHAVTGRNILIKYNMDPYSLKIGKAPNFISTVLRYVDKIDLGRFLDLSDKVAFKFTLMNKEGALANCDVEFKYSDNNCILEKVPCQLVPGENRICIPLRGMRSKALKQISEICFVIHPEDVNSMEGHFEIREIQIS